MKKSNKLDLISYILLVIPSLSAFLLTLGILGLTVYFGIEAFTTSADFGGWILIIMMLLGVVAVPILIACIIEWILYIIGLVNYKKQKMGRTRILALISAVMGMLNNFMVLGFCFGMMEDAPEAAIGAIVALLDVFFLLIPWTLLIISICKDRDKTKMENK